MNKKNLKETERIFKILLEAHSTMFFDHKHNNLPLSNNQKIINKNSKRIK